MKRKFSFFAFLLILLPIMVYGQKTGANRMMFFDQKTDSLVKERAKQVVNLYTDCLENIVSLDKKNNANNRRYLMRAALDLFRGKGDSIKTYVLDDNDEIIDSLMMDPVKIEVSSLYRKTKTNYTQKDYLNRLVRQANNQKTYKISIKSSEWYHMKVSSIRKIDDENYVIDVTFLQKYKRTGEDSHLIYADITRKRVTCYIGVVYTDYGPEFVIELGDIEAIETSGYNEYEV